MGTPDPLLLGLAPAPVAANHPRSPALAAFLALLCPGLGHFYCGSIGTALVWSVAPHGALLAMMFIGVFDASRLHLWMLAGMCLLIGLRLVQVLLAWRRAKPLREYRLQSTNGLGLYLAFFLGTSIFTSLISMSFREGVLEPFKMPVSAMEPSLTKGDEFFVVKVGPNSKVAAGDVIVYRPLEPSDSNLARVGRVVALEGHSVEFREDVLLLNDVEQPLEPCEPMYITTGEWKTQPLACFREGSHRIAHYASGRSYRPNIERTTVPAEHFYVVGDFRDNSVDSRELGPVPMANFVGRAAVIWLSFDAEKSLRTERIGLQP